VAAAQRASHLTTEVAAISTEARAAITAVSAVDRELVLLTESVRGIAERSGQAAHTAATGDVAQTFSSTAGAVEDMHQLQLTIASSVQEQATVLSSVAGQLSQATAAADQVLAGLERLATSA
jgi:methyl-accepting chemotaxis protein